ncbi:MAG: PKD domain-containing protein [Bacillota bacterium]
MAKSHWRKTPWIALLIMSLALALATAVGAAQSTPSGLPRGGWQPGPDIYHPSRVIVRFSDVVSSEHATQSIAALGYSVDRVADFGVSANFPHGLRIGIVELPDGVSPDTAVDRLSKTPGILYAEPDYIRYKDQAYGDAPIFPNDPQFNKMWGLHNQNCQFKDPRMSGDPVDDADIDAPEAWGICTGSEETVVAIIDTGCYILHPDLAPNIWVNPGEIPGNGIDDDGNGYIDDIWGWDWFNGDNSVWDPGERDQYGYLNDEHGTHTSGTIGAITNNAIGVAGINWNIKIMILKFLGPEGGYTSDAILAFNYAANKGAKVISCSWGGGGYNQALKDAIEATHAIVSCAAGNSGQNTDINPHYPSSYDSANIISVAAMMQNDTPCNYPGWWSTCWGPTSVDLYAPGGYILSTIPPDPPPSQPGEAYDFFYGTSMATPHVSGAAALLHSLRPGLPLYPSAPGSIPGQQTVKDILLNTVDVKPAYEGNVVSNGRLNIAAALLELGGPVITSIDAQPRFGPPPLEVTFTASAISPGGEIVDKWWDFGDGSTPVHEFNAVHTYTEQGDFTATFHAVDGEGLEATASLTIKVFFPPVIGVDPDEIHVDLWWAEETTRQVTVSNTGLGELNYSVNIRLVGKMNASGEARLGAGGPDSFGYFWLDTDEPGMEPPEWEDIRPIGTQITLEDDNGVVVDLPFEFPFYGQKKSQIAICSNGYLTFGGKLNAWTNTTIPNTADPNDLLAVFWDDLTLSSSGTCHYYGDEDIFIVQYTNVPRLSSGGPYTFQVRLSPQGVIMYQYLTMAGTRLNEATIGIENATGTVGLEVAYNKNYVHDDMGIMFLPGWIVSSSSGGTVEPGEVDTFDLMFFADHLPKGTWKAVVEIESNDPANPKVDVDTYMFVRSRINPTIRSASANPWAGSAPLEAHFSVDAYDQDGEVVDAIWDFGDGSPVVSGTFNPIHTYMAEGNYTATVIVVDDDGFEAAAEIDIVVTDLPQVAVDPASFNQVIRAHRQRTETLTVTNTGVATLEFAATAYTAGIPAEAGELDPFGAGGPDGFGYMWRDSDEPGGPIFEWVEISGIGTKLPVSGDDSGVVNLPFDFPFYGDIKTEIRICSDGYLTFGTKGTAYTNVAIPNPAEPNDMMAVYWDDLNPPQAPADGGVFHYYDAVNNRFIVQWNKVPRYYNNGQYTFQAILYPNGTIVYQYLNMQFASATYEKDGTIGIENATGTDGLQVLYNTPGYMHNNLAIRIKPISWMSVEPTEGELAPGESIGLDVTFDLALVGSGTLDGAVVLDTNDIRNPRTIVPVHIHVIPNSPPTITACAANPQQGPPGTSFQFVGAAYDPDGSLIDKYWSFGDGSPVVHEFVANHIYAAAGVYTAMFTAVDNDGYTATATVTVTVAQSASASWTPKQFSFTVGGGQTATGILTLSNAGPGALLFGSGEFPSMIQTPERLIAPEDIKDAEAKTAFGLYLPNQNPERSKWLPEAVGSVIKSWQCPSPIGDPWGVGVLLDSDEVVIADGAVDPTDDYVVTSDGAYTGRWWSADFGGSWSGDMAFDGTYIWQVNVGGDNAIYKVDPASGQTVGSIRNTAWASVSQRGLAYNANDDTFYIGGWNEDVIYKLKGESWDSPGAVIEQWSMPVSIAGLAYHPVADVLIVTCNSSPDMIYFVNATTHATIAQFQHPAGGAYMGVGCELARDGNLWVASWGENKMYLVETGLGPIGSGDWLSWQPAEGSVPAGGSVQITITANSEKLSPGPHEGNVVLTTNDVENPLIVVPVTLQVAEPPAITEATAEPTFGEPPLEVTFHAAFVAPEVPIASYGWNFGDGISSTELDVVHTYTLPGNYTATFTVLDQLGATAEATIDIVVKHSPHATVDPALIEITLPPNGEATETVTVGNVDGNAPLTFSVKVKGGSAPHVAMPERIGTVIDPNAATAEGLYMPFDPAAVERIAANIQPGGVGDVVKSWPAPAAVEIAWGLGFDATNVWLADPLPKNDYIITPEGVFTGTIFNTPWAGSWPGDMAYDSNRNLMWQVNVGGDNGIYGLNPATGEVVTKITSGGAWTSVSQRGLGYDADTDTFYIGGWNEDIIYHIMGPSWPTPGAVIAAYSFPVSIAGLEYHPDGVLWVSTNSAPDMIYGVDIESLAVIHQFQHPYRGDYSGAGLALNDDGNLWVASQTDNYVYLIDTEMPLSAGIVVQPTSGTVPTGQTADLAVTIKAAELGKPGQDVRKYLEILTNDPVNPALFVDLIVHIEPGPTIVEVTATPEIGQPPLTVAFAATVEAGAKPITDMWWEFGDGSDLVHEATTEHVYTDLGVYKAIFHVVDENDVEATAEVTVTVKWLPVLGVEPEEFDEVIQVGEEKQTILTVSNTGIAPMNFEIAVAPSFAESPEWKAYAASEPIKGDYASEPRGYAGAGAGGPDHYGYVWIDSKNPGGPAFDWVEISGLGTRVYLGDDDGVMVPLPFTFPFYGQMKTQIGISANGYLSFDPDSINYYWTNAPIPTSAKPNDMLAVFWDDLYPGGGGEIYYYNDTAGERFIVEYKNVPRLGGSASYTFQVILKPNGTIIYQYLNMVGLLNSATVGIENTTGTDGLQVLYNAAYIENDLAIGFAPVGSILKVNPTSGYLVPGGYQDVVLTLGSPDAPYGTYSLNLYVSANDPYRPFATIPVKLKLNAAPSVVITAPVGGAELHGTCEVEWTATDPDDDGDNLLIDLAWTRDGVEWHDLGTGLSNTGAFEWNTIEVGKAGDSFRLRARVTDPTGAYHEFVTGEFTIINNAPTADFGFTPSSATRRDVVKFTDKSTDDGRIVAWHWEFGDGTDSSEQNPEHRYAEKGEFTIALTVTDNGELKGTVEKSIVVGNAAPIAAFSFSPESPKAGEVVTFTNESTDDAEIIAYFWEFGDDTTSVAPEPTHTYATSGIFTVKLMVIDDDYTASSVEHDVEVVNAAPVAAFSFTPASPTVHDNVEFIDESTDDGPIAAWHWTFGDGAESDQQNPSHRYASKGKYTVTLTVTDNGGLLGTAEGEITVVNLPPEVTIVKPEVGTVWTGMQTIEWEAVDPDDDANTLKITLEYKPAGGQDWQTIAANQANTGTCVWDTSSVKQGGRYRIKVTATDPSDATGQAMSDEFTIVVLTHAIVAAPNPAKDGVTFYYDLAADATLYVYDIAGRLVYSAELPAAAHAHEWNLRSGDRPVANGVYLYIAVSGQEKTEVGRLVISR